MNMDEIRVEAHHASNQHAIQRVAQERLDAATTLHDPMDDVIFQPPCQTTTTKKRREAPNGKDSADTAASKRRTPAVAASRASSAKSSTDLSTNAVGASSTVNADEKARQFLHKKLVSIIQSNDALDSSAAVDDRQRRLELPLGAHSIARGNYIQETHPLTEVASVFSKYLVGGLDRGLMCESYTACMKLIAYRAYNGKADDCRRQKLVQGGSLPAHYMELVKLADRFRTWRSMLYTSLMCNLNESAQRFSHDETYKNVEDSHGYTTLNPLSLQKFFGYLLWITPTCSVETLAGKGRCYTCDVTLRENKSYIYRMPRLNVVDETAHPQASAGTPEERGANTSVSDERVPSAIRETISDQATDRQAFFQICSQCHEMTELFLSGRDTFRNEHNMAVLLLKQMCKDHAVLQLGPPSITVFVEQYMKWREPKRIWQDEVKRFRAFVNSLCVFLQKNCSESFARATSRVFYDIFNVSNDPRANPMDELVDVLTERSRSMVSLVDMSVEERLLYLQQQMLADTNVAAKMWLHQIK